MRWRRVGAALIVSMAVGRCGVVPPLEQATGEWDHAHSKILIREIVQRVKCEIADSFRAKLAQDRYKWLQDWTLKADLTLQINDLAGIAPSGSYTTFNKNVFNTAAGSTSQTTRSIAAVQQFFTVSAGANVGGQATRTELVSFSLALDELEAWRDEVAKQESDPNFPIESRICVPREQFGLAAGLGLDEWIDSALSPVHERDLLAGYHPAPGTSKAATASSPVGPPKPVGAAPNVGAKLSDEDKKKLIKEIKDGFIAVGASKLQVENSAALVAATKANLDKALRTMLERRKAYASISTPPVKKSFDTAYAQLSALAALSHEDNTIATNDTRYANLAYDSAKKAVDDLDTTDPGYQLDANRVADAAAYIDTVAKHIKVVADHAQSVEKVAATISVSPDPPIDSILHSVQFIVSYGANITPSWTLLAWKGPGLTGSGASAQGMRTHILQIALGPRGAGGAKTSEEQNRLITNNTLLLTRTSP